MARCEGEGEERLFDPLAVGECRRRRRSSAGSAGRPRLTRAACRCDRGPPVAGADEQLREPGIESLRFTQPRQVTPGLDDGLLERVLGRVRVAKDLARDSQEPITAPAGRAVRTRPGRRGRIPTDQSPDGRAGRGSGQPSRATIQASRDGASAAVISGGCARSRRWPSAGTHCSVVVAVSAEGRAHRVDRAVEVLGHVLGPLSRDSSLSSQLSYAPVFWKMTPSPGAETASVVPVYVFVLDVTTPGTA